MTHFEHKMVNVELPTKSVTRRFQYSLINTWFQGGGKHFGLNRRRRIAWKRPADCPSKCKISARIVISVFLVIISIFRYLDSPGKNYLSFGFWRCSHRSNSEIRSIQSSFPVHIEDDFEWIDHPGFLFSDEEKLKFITSGLNISRSIRVPKFWNPPEYGKNGVREFLGYKGKFLITKEEALSIGSTHHSQETIFVAVASYRDPECLPTVEDIFLRAKNPERIRVGIVDQIVEGDISCNQPREPCEQNPDQILCKYGHLIDSVQYSARYMVGPTFARHIANRMYRGEYYTMQVDSHVRFVANWDEDIVQQWKSIGNEMAVITNYMSDITNSIDPNTHKSLRETRSMMCRIEYEWPGDIKEHLKYMVQPNNKPRIKDVPMLQPFWAAGFSFGRGHFTVQVPYDQYLPMVFQGEEISMTVRGFTFGYDYYSPARNVAFHIYQVRQNRETRSQVNKFSENSVLFPGAKTESYLRLNGIIGAGDPSKAYNDVQEENYGVGQVRSREKFYQTFGIDTSMHEIQEGLCEFVQGTGIVEPMQVKFSKALRFDSIGIDYSRITYEHKTPIRTETEIDEVELAILRERLRKKK